MKESDRFVKEMVALRLAAFRMNPYFREGRKTRAWLIKSYGESCAQASKSGVVESLYSPRGDLLAGFVLAPSHCQMTGRKNHAATIDLVASSRVARSWVLQMMKKHGTACKELEMRLMWPYRELAIGMEKLGFRVEAVVQVGEVVRAKALMERKYGKLDERDWPTGLSSARLSSRAEVEGMLRLDRQQFTKNPQFGWFVTHPEFVRRQRKDLRAIASKPNTTHFLLLEKGKVVGFFGATLLLDNPMLGRMGSIMICLDSRLQGKGLSPICYQILLREMKKRRVRVFSGGTAQGPVMHLGNAMKRHPLSLMVRTGKPWFKARYFLNGAASPAK
ncbi:MAG: hypothetical protein ACXVBW_12105 [Bdellovibrionota bacterium]